MDVDVPTGGDGAPVEPLPWPETLAERAQAVRQVVTASGAALSTEEVASQFYRARRK